MTEAKAGAAGESRQTNAGKPDAEAIAAQLTALEKVLDQDTKESEAIQAQDQAAVSALRDAAKWFIGGVAVAVGAVVAGSSLTSLGSLGFDWLGDERRLVVAFCGALVGLCGLMLLLASAITILEPRTYDWRAILVRGESVPARDLKKVLAKVEPTLPTGAPKLRDAATAHAALTNAIRAGAAPEEILRAKRALIGNFLAKAMSAIRFEYSRLMFERLKRRLFALMPIIALAFAVFAWAANPPKDNAADVTPMIKEIVVDPNDVADLRRSMTALCVGTKLTVIVVKELRSGSQEVVTVPSGTCFPVRLRLDHGRLASAR